MPDQHPKVAILGCCGIGQTVSTVIRRAVYAVRDARPESVVLIGSGPLTGDVPEVLEAASRHPLVVIDGCSPRCATKLAEGKQLEVAATIYAGRILTQNRLSLLGEKREELGETGLAASRAIADAILETVDRLLQEQSNSAAG